MTCPHCGYDIPADDLEHDDFCTWASVAMRGPFDRWRLDDEREQDRIADEVQRRNGAVEPPVCVQNVRFSVT